MWLHRASRALWDKLTPAMRQAQIEPLRRLVRAICRTYCDHTDLVGPLLTVLTNDEACLLAKEQVRAQRRASHNELHTKFIEALGADVRDDGPDAPLPKSDAPPKPAVPTPGEIDRFLSWLETVDVDPEHFRCEMYKSPLRSMIDFVDATQLARMERALGRGAYRYDEDRTAISIRWAQLGEYDRAVASTETVDFGPNQRQARLRIATLTKRADHVVRSLRSQIQQGFTGSSPEILHGCDWAVENGFVREVYEVIDEITDPSCRLIVRASLVTDASSDALETARLSPADLQRQLEADLDACLAVRFEPRFTVFLYILDAVSAQHRLRAWGYTFSSAECMREPSVGGYLPTVGRDISQVLAPIPNARELVRQALAHWSKVAAVESFDEPRGKL